MIRPGALIGLFALQAICAILAVFNTVVSAFGLLDRPISWQIHELIELGAILGLILGTLLGAIALRRSELRRAHVEDRLRAASGAFADLLRARFQGWGLTPAEKDVALFSIKGLSLTEIASLRGTSEGTVKAQTAAVYRKAGVSGRAALVSSFIEDLMGESLLSPEELAAEDDQVELTFEEGRG